MGNCIPKGSAYNPLPNASKSISLFHSHSGMSAFQQWRLNASLRNADRMREESLRDEVAANALSRNGDDKPMKLMQLRPPLFSRIIYPSILLQYPQNLRYPQNGSKKKGSHVLPLHLCMRRIRISKMNKSIDYTLVPN